MAENKTNRWCIGIDMIGIPVEVNIYLQNDTNNPYPSAVESLYDSIQLNQSKVKEDIRKTIQGIIDKYPTNFRHFAAVNRTSINTRYNDNLINRMFNPSVEYKQAIILAAYDTIIHGLVNKTSTNQQEYIFEDTKNNKEYNDINPDETFVVMKNEDIDFENYCRIS